MMSSYIISEINSERQRLIRSDAGTFYDFSYPMLSFKKTYVIQTENVIDGVYNTNRHHETS